VKAAVMRFFWRIFNPIARSLAGVAPWWVVLETTGRKTGRTRQAPLARGPVDGNVAWLIAVHGRHSGIVRNIEANPNVRLRLRGRWRAGTATTLPLDPAIVKRFNRYGQSGPKLVGWDPLLVRIDLTD
jgi:deazaflavin-dependent oxidoreductase (nitroreductase family)